MKKILALVVLVALSSCTSETLMPYDADLFAARIQIKGYSKPDTLQLRLNGKPLTIGDKETYVENIETRVDFVIDGDETNTLSIYSTTTGAEIKKYEINKNNFLEYKNLYFFNLPDIFLETYAVKPQVNLGKVGFVFLFPNLGEYSGSDLENVKGILKKENGAVLAEFDSIGKQAFTDLKIYNFFSATAPVILELYKPGTTEPYTGSLPIQVQIIQTYGANMIVLQEKLENGTLVIKGDIDIADYL